MTENLKYDVVLVFIMETPTSSCTTVIFETLLVSLISISVYLYFSNVETYFHNDLPPTENIYELPDTTRPLPPSDSKMCYYSDSAVCGDTKVCEEIGKRILIKKGSAVDAAIAALICNGLVNMHNMGLGGGFFMLIFDKVENRVYAINARERASKHATNSLFQKEDSIANGPLSICIPGEMKGYLAAHERFGVLPWNELVEPSIKLCEKGYILNKGQFNALKKYANIMKNDQNFREWFFDEEGNIKQQGSKIIPTKLCETLKVLSANGPDEFYNGNISKIIAKDIKEAGGIISEEDLNEYQVDWQEPHEVTLKHGYKLYSAPPPASGVILGFIMNILQGYNFTKESTNGVKNTITTYHRIVEAYKFAYGKRTELGDPHFVNIGRLLKELNSKGYAESIRVKIRDDKTFESPEYYGGKFFSGTDHGTSHLSVVSDNGNAVAVTSSINTCFGSIFTSKSTGIVFNNHMDDFSFSWRVNYYGLIGSPSNKMEPGKRPLSSMCPTIIVDQRNNVFLVLGGAGGSQITSSVALTLIRILWFEYTIKEAIDGPRIHHQLLPMQLNYEYGVLEQVVNGLKAKGHKMKRSIGSILCVLQKNKEYIFGIADYRKGWDVS